MRRRRRLGLFAGTAGAVLLVSGAAPGDLLAQAIEERSQANREGVQSQLRIDELADQTDRMLTEYRSALKQIESLRLYNRQAEDLIAAQHEEMTSIQQQIDEVEVVGRGVSPLMFKMIEALDQFIHLDIPFVMKERTERVAELRELIERSDVTDAEKFRRILEAYQIENEFGRTIEAYRSSLSRGDRQVTVDFLRVGRIALVYLTLDGNEAGVWDQSHRGWKPLESRYISAIQEGLRVARKQAAPDMIRLPLPAPQAAGDGA